MYILWKCKKTSVEIQFRWSFGIFWVASTMGNSTTLYYAHQRGCEQSWNMCLNSKPYRANRWRTHSIVRVQSAFIDGYLVQTIRSENRPCINQRKCNSISKSGRWLQKHDRRFYVVLEYLKPYWTYNNQISCVFRMVKITWIFRSWQKGVQRCWEWRQKHEHILQITESDSQVSCIALYDQD